MYIKYDYCKTSIERLFSEHEHDSFRITIHIVRLCMPIKLVFLAFLDMSSGTSDALIFINILVFFVGLSLIVLCYLCDFFFLTLSRSFTRFHNHDNIVQTSSIHLLKGIVSLHSQRNRFQNRRYIRLIGKETFL